MIIPGQFGFNYPSGFREEAFWNIFPIGKGPLQIYVFYADRKSKMAATTGHRLTLDPIGKYSNAFFSETEMYILHSRLMLNLFFALSCLWCYCREEFEDTVSSAIRLSIPLVQKVCHENWIAVIGLS
jgi:hypothetical protein